MILIYVEFVVLRQMMMYLSERNYCENILGNGRISTIGIFVSVRELSANTNEVNRLDMTN